MKKVSIFSFFILGLFFAATTLAQGSPEQLTTGRWEPPGQYSKMFDPNTLETFSGEVTTVDQITPGYEMACPTGSGWVCKPTST
jgi:hypothetical protein